MFLKIKIELEKKKLCRNILKYGLQDEKTKKISIKLNELINTYNNKKIKK